MSFSIRLRRLHRYRFYGLRAIVRQLNIHSPGDWSPIVLEVKWNAEGRRQFKLHAVEKVPCAPRSLSHPLSENQSRSIWLSCLFP